MKRNTLTVIIGAVLVLIFALLLFTFQVRRSETAVVATFGKPVATYTNAGAYFKMPWPIQKVYKYDQRVQNFEDKFSQNYTKDNVTLLSSVYVGWKISDAGQFLQVFPGDSSVSLPNAQSKLEQMLRSSKSAVVGGHPLSDFVNVNPQDLKFDAIEKEIEQDVQDRLRTNNYGMEIEFLGFRKIGLPDSVTQTVFDRMKSDRQKQISLAENTGKSEAQKIQSAADAEAAKTIANAQATATRILGEGEAEAAKTLPIFEQNPDLAIFLLRIDAIKQSLNQRSTLFFDDRIPPFDLFSHLPTNAPSHRP
jgi:membrane protease subunit HflC